MVVGCTNRWPLVLRFIKGAIHGVIALPVVLHALFAVLIVFIDQNLDRNLGLPTSIVRNSHLFPALLCSS